MPRKKLLARKKYLQGAVIKTLGSFVLPLQVTIDLRCNGGERLTMFGTREMGMSEPLASRQPDSAVDLAAIDWHVRLRDTALSDDDRMAFARWLDESPRHAEAIAEIDRIDKTLETRRSTSALLSQFLNPFESIQFGTTEELIARRKELFEINKKLGAQQAELNAQKPAAAGAGTSAVAAKAAAESAKAQAKAAEDLVAITRELDQAAMTPLGKTIDEIRVKYAGFATTGATAFKGQAAQLDAFNAKLDATREKLAEVDDDATAPNRNPPPIAEPAPDREAAATEDAVVRATAAE